MSDWFSPDAPPNPKPAPPPIDEEQVEMSQSRLSKIRAKQRKGRKSTILDASDAPMEAVAPQSEKTTLLGE